jgi:hypothetical protein
VTLPRLFLAQYSFRVRPVIQIVEALCTKYNNNNNNSR